MVYSIITFISNKLNKQISKEQINLITNKNNISNHKKASFIGCF